MKLQNLIVLGLVTVSQAAFASSASIPAGTYEIDPAHSKVGFEVSHLVISTVEGKFGKYKGDVVVGAKAGDIKTTMDIETASVDTGNADRDKHLRNADFFDVEKHPTMTFKSKKVTLDGSKVKILGDLTLHGVTKPVTFEGKYLGTVKDMMGSDRIAASAEAKINRKDFGLVWNKMIEAGPAVGDEVAMLLKIEAVRKK